MSFERHSGNKWGNAVLLAERGMYEEGGMDESEYLQSKTKRVKSESMDSTRRALARLNEASLIAEHNLNLVNSQSEQFNYMERKLDETGANVKSVDAKVDHLKSLSKHFFLPFFGGKKVDKKEEEFKKQQEAKKFDSKHSRKTDEHWDKRNDRLNDAGPRKFYSIPQGLEREIDNNLGQISTGLSRLRMIGLQMGEELQHHDEQIKRIDERAGFTRDKISKINSKVDKIARK